jgi:multiple sugar transport system permease protein
MFVLPAVVFLVCVVLYPLLQIFPWSLDTWSAETHSFVFVGLQEFRRLLAEPEFWHSIKITFFFTGLVVAGHLVIAWVLAEVLNSKLWPGHRLRNLVRSLLLLPWIFSVSAAALIWGALYHPIGYLSYYVSHLLGVSSVGFLSNPDLTLFSVVFVILWKFYPLYMLMILGGLESLPEEVYEAARVDGVSWRQSFFQITIPLMRSLTLTVVLIDFITTFIHFDLVWIMTKGGPVNSTYLVSFYLYERGLQTSSFGYASAIGVFVALLFGILMYAYIVAFYRREA